MSVFDSLNGAPPGEGAVAVAAGPATNTSSGSPGHASPGSDHWQHRLGRALSHRWRRAVVVGVALAAGLGALGVSTVLSGPTTYSSQTVMAIDSPYGLAAAGDEGQLLKLDEIRYKYASLATTYLIAQPVARSLGTSVGAVLGGTSVVPESDALLMTVTGTWSTPSGAARLSSAVASELSTYVQNENSSYAIPVNDQFFLRAVDPTTTPTAHGPSHSKALTLGLGLALAGLLAGFLLTQLLANRRLLGT